MTERITAGLLLPQWTQLRYVMEKSGPADIPVMDLGSHSGRDMWTSVLADGSPALLIEKRPDEKSPTTVGAANISVAERYLTYRGRELQVVQLDCRDRNLEPIFAEVCLMVLDKLRSGSAISDAITGILSDLRQLLGVGGRPSPVRRMDIGLLGEMLVLRNLVYADWQNYLAWTGPAGSRFDFRSGGIAIEIKTYRKKQTDTVTISSLDQLDPPAGATLWLQTVELEPDPKGDITYSALHSQIRGCLPPRYQVRFEEQMHEAADLDSIGDLTQAYSLNALRLYRVGKGFPAVTRSSLVDGELPVGVSHVRYRLDLAAARDWLVDKEVSTLVSGNVAEHDAGA